MNRNRTLTIQDVYADRCRVRVRRRACVRAGVALDGLLHQQPAGREAPLLRHQ